MLEESYKRIAPELIRMVGTGGRDFLSAIKSRVSTQNAHQDWWKSYLLGDAIRFRGKGRGEIGILDLFSGCGGLGLGVSEAVRALGWKPRIEAAVDVDADGLKIYEANLQPWQVLNASVPSLIDYQVFGVGADAEFAYTPEPTDDRLQELKGRVDLICAGPPCQGHSNLNNQSRRDDPRNLLYLAVPAIAVALDVEMVIIENVPDVVNDSYGVVETARALLRRHGYKLDGEVLSASELGWAQTRKRYFMVATKEREPVPLQEIKRTLKRQPAPVMWAIDDLEDSIDERYVFDSVPEMSAENLARVYYLFSEGKYDLPDEHRPDCHKDGHTYPSVYGRMRPDLPSGTITTGFMTPGRGRFIHPTRPRVLTAHEAARIQGFPDSYSFALKGKTPPSRKLLGKWIGDAVPPILGYTAAHGALIGRA
jgi:DNA (cytosine-5)-methyltransferase 1